MIVPFKNIGKFSKKTSLYVILFIGIPFCVFTIITTVMGFSTLPQPEIISALMAFLPVAISVEIALAGFTTAILVLCFSFINSDNYSKNRIEVKTLTRLPQLIIAVCLIGCFHSSITYLFVSAGLYTNYSILSLVWSVGVSEFMFLSALGTFALLSWAITQYGLDRINSKRTNINNQTCHRCRNIRR